MYRMANHSLNIEVLNKGSFRKGDLINDKNMVVKNDNHVLHAFILLQLNFDFPFSLSGWSPVQLLIVLTEHGTANS